MYSIELSLEGRQTDLKAPDGFGRFEGWLFLGLCIDGTKNRTQFPGTRFFESFVGRYFFFPISAPDLIK